MPCAGSSTSECCPHKYSSTERSAGSNRAEWASQVFARDDNLKICRHIPIQLRWAKKSPSCTQKISPVRLSEPGLFCARPRLQTPSRRKCQVFSDRYEHAYKAPLQLHLSLTRSRPQISAMFKLVWVFVLATLAATVSGTAYSSCPVQQESGATLTTGVRVAESVLARSCSFDPAREEPERNR